MTQMPSQTQAMLDLFVRLDRLLSEAERTKQALHRLLKGGEPEDPKTEVKKVVAGAC
jgi:hypothetical protein